MPHTYDGSVDPGDLILPQGLKPVMWDDGTGSRTPADFWTQHDTLRSEIRSAITQLRSNLATVVELNPDAMLGMVNSRALTDENGANWRVLLDELASDKVDSNGHALTFEHAPDGRLMVNREEFDRSSETIEGFTKRLGGLKWKGPNYELGGKHRFTEARKAARAQVKLLSEAYTKLTELYYTNGCVYEITSRDGTKLDATKIEEQSYKTFPTITERTKTWDIAYNIGAPKEFWESVGTARLDFDHSYDKIILRHTGSRPTMIHEDPVASDVTAPSEAVRNSPPDTDEDMGEADEGAYDSDQAMFDVTDSDDEEEEEGASQQLSDEQQADLDSLLEVSKRLYRRATPLTQPMYCLSDGLFEADVESLHKLETDMYELTERYLAFEPQEPKIVRNLQDASLAFSDSFKKLSRALQDIEYTQMGLEEEQEKA